MPQPSDTWTPIPDHVSLLPVLRALLKSCGTVQQAIARHVDSLGLTPARFDVLSALGDTEGMTVKELCDVSLITKGTLLPVIAALEDLGWVQRAKDPRDHRQTIVSLTRAGQAMYEQTFLVHVEHMRSYLDRLSPEEQQTLVRLLGKLEASFTQDEAPLQNS